MRALVIAVLFAAVLPSQTVTLRKPDGTYWTGTLPAHPRVVFDAATKARLADSDGDGPGVAPLLALNPPRPYISAAWNGLHQTTLSTRKYVKDNAKTLLLTALGYYMDHNASFSGNHRSCTGGKLDGSVSDLITDSQGNTYHDCYKWFALDLMKNWADRRPDSGSCFFATSQCGTEINTALEDPQFYGDNVTWTATAYTLLRDLLTPPERQAFAASQFNGAIPPDGTFPACQNRIPDHPTYNGTFRYTAPSAGFCTGNYETNGTIVPPFTAQWTGETLPTSLVGKPIFFHPKTGQQSFTSQTSIAIQTPGYRAAQASCWDQAGNKLTPSATSFTTGNTTLTFATPQTGTCIASIEMSNRNGSFGIVRSVDPVAGTFTFDSCGYRRDQDNVMYVVSPGGPNTCGYIWVGIHYGNTPAYACGTASSSLASAITPSATTITVTSATGFPPVPFYITLGTYREETVRVTAVAGNTFTVDRGIYNTIGRAWPSGTYLEWRFIGPGLSTDYNGWNNRDLTKQQMLIASAAAYADEAPASAADLLAAASDFFYNNASIAINKYHGLLTGSALTYSITRVWHHYTTIAEMLSAISGGAVDYRADWMKKGMGLYLPVWSLPWDQYRFPQIGQSSTSCKSLLGSADGQCYEPAVEIQKLYRDSTEAKYAWKFAIESGRLTSAGDLSANTRAMLAILLYTDGTETGADWKGTLPSHYIDTGSNPKDPTTNLSLAVSRTDWSPTATFAYINAVDGYGDKWIDVPTGHYVIGKNGDFFMGSANGTPYAWWDTGHGNLNYDNYEVFQNTVSIGNPTSYQVSGNDDRPRNADFSQEFDKRLSDDTPGGGKFMYLRVESKQAFDAKRLGFGITRKYRHFAHFKPTGGAEQFVVFDDIGTSGPALVRMQMPYNNNGQTSAYLKGYPREGWTDLSANGKQVVSVSYTGTQKMVTDILRGGRQYISDINAEYTTPTLTLCYDCTTDHPAHVVANGKSWSYSAPMTATFTRTSGGDWFFWVDPTDGTVHGAPKTGYTITSCSGPITCGAPIADWPAGVIRIAKVNTRAGACPGSLGGTNGVEDYHCRNYDSEHAVYLGEGYSATASDFLVTHQIKTMAESPDPVAEITTIDPNFVGVQIGGVNPKVAVFGKGTATSLFTEASFTSTHSGTAQYLVAGLTAGTYTVKRNGAAAGVYTVTGTSGAIYFEATSGAYEVTQTGTLTLQVTTAALADGISGALYSQTLAATGGTPPYSWSIQSGALPSGLSMNAGGTITGTPTATGASSFVVRVADSAGAEATRSLTLNVTPGNTVQITTAGLPPGIAGMAYSATLSAINGMAPYVWTLTAGALPDGLSMIPGGIIQGQPASAGSWTFTVRVTDRAGTTDSHTYTLGVDAASAPLDILSPAALPGVGLGNSYAYALEATGGTIPYVWQITAGSLPPGVILTSPTLGTLTGTPTAAGVYSFTAQVTDSLDGTVSRQFSIVVNETEPLVLDTEFLPNGFVGQAYSFTLSASGGTPPYTWSIAGSLPSGLALDPTSGAITGAPQEVSDSPIEVTVTDADGTTAVASFVSSTLRYVTAENIEVVPLSRQALVKYGFAGLRVEATCSVEARSTDPSGPVMSRVTDQGGPSRRTAVLSNLDPGTIHSVELRCEDFGGRRIFQTRGVAPGLSISAVGKDLKVQMAAPPGLGATQLLLSYGDNPSMLGSTTTAQCSGKCETIISVIPDTVVYLQPKWLNAQGQVLTTGAVKVVAVP